MIFQVGSCDVKFPIRLEGLVLTHSQFSSYEPELFPGLIYRMVKPRIVILIFVSGKVGEVLQSWHFSCCFLLGCPHRSQGEAGDLWGIWQHLPHPQELQEAVISLCSCISVHWKTNCEIFFYVLVERGSSRGSESVLLLRQLVSLCVLIFDVVNIWSFLKWYYFDSLIINISFTTHSTPSKGLRQLFITTYVVEEC